MAGEHVLDCAIWAHRVNNPYGVFVPIALAGNEHSPGAWPLPVTPACDLNAATKKPAPYNVHATPNLLARIWWRTVGVDVTNPTRIYVRARVVAPNAAPPGAGAWDDQVYIDDVSGGQYWLNQAQVALPNTSAKFVAGVKVELLIRRDRVGIPAPDPFNNAVWLEEVFLVADADLT